MDETLDCRGMPTLGNLGLMLSATSACTMASGDVPNHHSPRRRKSFLSLFPPPRSDRGRKLFASPPASAQAASGHLKAKRQGAASCWRGPLRAEGKKNLLIFSPRSRPWVSTVQPRPYIRLHSRYLPCALRLAATPLVLYLGARVVRVGVPSERSVLVPTLAGLSSPSSHTAWWQGRPRHQPPVRGYSSLLILSFKFPLLSTVKTGVQNSEARLSFAFLPCDCDARLVRIRHGVTDGASGGGLGPKGHRICARWCLNGLNSVLQLGFMPVSQASFAAIPSAPHGGKRLLTPLSVNALNFPRFKKFPASISRYSGVLARKECTWTLRGLPPPHAGCLH
eukprot:scaffold70763_cov32-Tisochrysis_lutea.AAC.2